MRLLSFSLLLTLLITFCSAQTERSSGSGGFSLGTGWGFDLGYGKVKVYEDAHLTGWRVTGSLWTPTFDSGNPAGEEGYFDWFVPTDKTEKKYGWGIGFLYLYNKLGGGVMLDYIVNVSYQNYRSPATGLDWHTGPSRSSSVGVTLNLTYELGSQFDGTVFLGTGRGIMLGGVMKF